MEITPEWLRQQIDSCREQERKFIASANIANGAAQSLEAVLARLSAPQEPT